MRILNKCMLTAAIICGVSSSAFAISIDEFNDEIATTSSSAAIDNSNVLGGERDVRLNSNTSYRSTGGVATLTGAPTGISSLNLYYDGDDDDSTLGFGLGGVDLTSGGTADRFILSVSSFTGLIPGITLSIHDSASDFSRTGPLTITSAGIFEIPFAAFTFISGAGASFADVNAFRILFADNASSGGQGSVSLDYIRTNGRMAPVPEPSTFALMALAMGGLLFRRRLQA